MERQFLGKYAIKETFSIQSNTHPAFLNHAKNHLFAKLAKVFTIKVKCHPEKVGCGQNLSEAGLKQQASSAHKGNTMRTG